MTNVLVLGSEGMLGHMLLAALRQVAGWRVEGTQFQDPGAPWYFDAEAGVEALARLDPAHTPFHYYINCIGLTKANIRETDPASVVRAIALNTTFPQALAGWAREMKARVIHISTDGVFSQGRGGFTESRTPDAADVYGQSKLLGEVKNNPAVISVRCSIVGPSPRERGGLLEWFLQQPEGAQIPGYTNHQWKGGTTLQFASLARTLLADQAFDALRQAGPVFHWAPNQAVSKFELLSLFKAVFAKGVTVLPVAAPSGVDRVLTSEIEAWRRLFPENLSLQGALQELKAFMQTEAYLTYSKGRWQ
jgi:dTDP-4-dehydrorhamnose reductase